MKNHDAYYIFLSLFLTLCAFVLGGVGVLYGHTPFGMRAQFWGAILFLFSGLPLVVGMILLALED